MIGQQAATFKKSITSLAKGALPVIIYLTLPPNAALVLLNTKAS